jgi:hypothetical protein
MAYSFCGFIGSKAALDNLARRFSNARLIGLPQDVFVIQLVDSVIQEMNGGKSSETVDGFEYLSKGIEALAASVSHDGHLAYVEVFLSVGEGDQGAIMWEKGKQTKIISGDEVINSVLRRLGAVANKEQDEFLTMGFGLRRFTEDWLED